MKKIILILSMVIITGLFTVSNASSAAITESNDVKVSINGTVGTYANNPININGRTLLPLRELLVNLGVANDDQHIIWNSNDHSVTVIKDSTQIYLVVGDTNAKVNSKSVTIDAAPVNYNSKVYIPARFVAEAFGMDVTWNPNTKVISIQGSKELKSADGKFTITIPGNWVEAKDLNDEADLQVMEKDENAFCAALIESKADFTNFETWKKATLDNTTKSYTNVTVSDPSNITVNGNPAVQYVMTATYEEDVNVKLLLTYVNGSNYYGQILSWSLVSEYNNYEKYLKQISSSIQGL